MGPLGPLWGMGKGHFLYLAMYCEAKEHKTSGGGVVARTTRYKSEDQAEHRNQAVEAKAGDQEGRKPRIVKKQNEPEAVIRKSRNKNGICPFTPSLREIFKVSLLPT